MTREVTEQDFRRPEFFHAKVEDYEFRHDGKVVRKDRWEMGIRKIASILRIPGEWEISEVVQAVDALELAANPEYVCVNPKCGQEGRRSDFLSHESGLVCPTCSELVEPLDKPETYVILVAPEVPCSYLAAESDEDDGEPSSGPPRTSERETALTFNNFFAAHAALQAALGRYPKHEFLVRKVTP